LKPTLCQPVTGLYNEKTCLLLHMQRIVQYKVIFVYKVQILSILRYTLLLIPLVQEIYIVSNMLNFLCFVLSLIYFIIHKFHPRKDIQVLTYPNVHIVEIIKPKFWILLSQISVDASCRKYLLHFEFKATENT